jgi:hypothetical protein
MSALRLRKTGPNVTELRTGGGAFVLFSYDTPVAAIIPGSGWFRTEKHHSPTTSRHIGQRIPAGAEVEWRPQTWFDGLLSVSLEVER